jgi:Tfp pilus assembly protein FimT
VAAASFGHSASHNKIQNLADHLSHQEILARAAALVSQTSITTQVRVNPCRHFIQMSEDEDDYQTSLYWLRQLSLKPLLHKSDFFASSGLEVVCIVCLRHAVC